MVVKRTSKKRKATTRQGLEVTLAFIHSHLHERLSLTDLAVKSGSSVSYFARCFKEVTGLPPKQYILRQRLERAHQLLVKGEVSVAEVAIQTGFSDQSHLVKYFKRKWGLTPRDLLAGQQLIQSRTKNVLETVRVPILLAEKRLLQTDSKERLLN
jgi:AraC family transcriptional regulator